MPTITVAEARILREFEFWNAGIIQQDLGWGYVPLSPNPRTCEKFGFATLADAQRDIIERYRVSR